MMAGALIKNPKQNIMLIKQKGRCEICNSELGPFDTVQSKNVTCSNCEKKVIVCRSCKEEGCKCGGNFWDTWDKNPGIMFK